MGPSSKILRGVKIATVEVWAGIVWIWLFVSVWVVLLGGLFLFPILKESQGSTSSLQLSAFYFSYGLWLLLVLPVGLFLAWKIHTSIFPKRGKENG